MGLRMEVIEPLGVERARYAIGGAPQETAGVSGAAGGGGGGGGGGGAGGGGELAAGGGGK
ncbi:MAG: hypothetical protein ACI8RE_002603 [Ilumatobacter sp.]|jgi:hypothetical protein